MKLFAIDQAQLERLKRVAKRLYSEDRLNGDQMRDLAQALTSVSDAAIEIPDTLAATLELLEALEAAAFALEPTGTPTTEAEKYRAKAAAAARAVIARVLEKR